MSHLSNKLPLRPNVCMLLFNRVGQLFLAERHGFPGVWQFPQGGVDAAESLEDNVLRELQEELGLQKDKLQICLRCQATNDYEFVDPPGYAKGKWRGQSQSFWLVKFLGSDSDINLAQPEQELMAWRWCSPDEVLKLAEVKRIPGYIGPISEFKDWWRVNNP